MTTKEFEKLKVGDRIVDIHTNFTWLVIRRRVRSDATGHEFVLIQTGIALNPPDWEKVDKEPQKHPVGNNDHFWDRVEGLSIKKTKKARRK